jgi:hypothetical protein
VTLLRPQGAYEDTDGSLLSPATLAPFGGASGFPPAFPLGSPWVGATLHSGVSSSLFDPAECVRLQGPQASGFPTSNNAVVCAPSAGTFRRFYFLHRLNGGPTGVRSCV